MQTEKIEHRREIEERILNRTNKLFVEKMIDKHTKEIYYEVKETLNTINKIPSSKITADQAIDFYNDRLQASMKHEYESLLNKVTLEELR